EAVERAGGDLVDAGDGAERLLQTFDDLALDLGRRRAGVGHGEEDDQVGEVRELVDVDAEEREEAEDHEDQHRHDGDDGALDGEIGDRHSFCANFSASWRAAGVSSTGVPGAISWAAPWRTMSPAWTPRTISTLCSRSSMSPSWTWMR